MHVCMYVGRYVGMCICPPSGCMFMFMHICVFTYEYEHTHVCTPQYPAETTTSNKTCRSGYLCLCTCVCSCMHARLNARMHDEQQTCRLDTSTYTSYIYHTQI